MQPGLHALNCSNCGAPLDPTEQSKGAVVSCELCGQPHLWIAPGKVEARGPAPPKPPGQQVATVPARPPQKRTGWVLGLVLGGVAVALVVLAGVGASAYWLAAEGGSGAVAAKPSMPFALGDRLYMQIDNHSCDFTIRGFAADGSLLGKHCNGKSDMPALWETLRLNQAYAPLEEGSVVIFRTENTSWARGEVLAPRPNQRLLIRPLSKGEATSMPVAQKNVFEVQSNNANYHESVPLPAAAPVEKGDVLHWRDDNLLRAARIEVVDAATPTIQPGSVMRNYDFVAQKKAEPKKVPRSELEANIVLSRTALKPDSVVLQRQQDGSWKRLTVVAEQPHFVVKVKSAAGGDELVYKLNMLVVRGWSY